MKKRAAFANKIKALRKARGLTQFELAEAIERSAETVSQIERGKFFPSFETLELLAEVLHVPIKDFFDLPTDDKTHKKNLLLSELYAVASTLDEISLEIALVQIKAFRAN